MNRRPSDYEPAALPNCATPRRTVAQEERLALPPSGFGDRPLYLSYSRIGGMAPEDKSIPRPPLHLVMTSLRSFPSVYRDFQSASDFIYGVLRRYVVRQARHQNVAVVFSGY